MDYKAGVTFFSDGVHQKNFLRCIYLIFIFLLIWFYFQKSKNETLIVKNTNAVASKGQVIFMILNAVLLSRNNLFSAPAPPLSLISATAPAPAIYCHLNLFYNSSILLEVDIGFLHPSILQTDCRKYLLKNNFGSGSRSQIISAPPTPAPQHC